MTNKFIVTIAASAISLLALSGCDNASEEAAVEEEVTEEADDMMEDVGDAVVPVPQRWRLFSARERPCDGTD